MANLKAPVSLSDLVSEWREDAPMNVTEPGLEMMRVPNLHAKYLAILTYHSMRVKKIMLDYKKLRQVKFDYYDGSLNNPEDLEKHGLPPNQRRYLKTQIPDLLDADDDLNKILMDKMVHDEIVEFCKAVIKELNNRVWQVRSFIDWQKFTNP